MAKPDEAIELCIGWDVGGWNCDKNPRSRDALVVLDAHRNLLGVPWRGNLREAINDSGSCLDFIQSILYLCKADLSASELSRVTLAIDTPLAFSTDFVALLNGRTNVDEIEQSETNPYLFRYTEQYLFQRGLKPLSAIKDMIGSQATKGMHVLAKFSPEIKQTGVWTDGHFLDVIEAYPSACMHSTTVEDLCKPFIDEAYVDDKPIGSFVDMGFKQITHEDERDALLCALLAWLFEHQPKSLAWPDAETPESEGWIFVPKDFMPHDHVMLRITNKS